MADPNDNFTGCSRAVVTPVQLSLKSPQTSANDSSVYRQPPVVNNNNNSRSGNAATNSTGPGGSPGETTGQPPAGRKEAGKGLYVKKGKSGANNHYKRAPIVVWQNGSPTMSPRSPLKSPQDFQEKLSPGSRGSEIFQDSSESTATEDLSSLAAERRLAVSPAAFSIGRSVGTPPSSPSSLSHCHLEPVNPDPNDERTNLLSPTIDTCTEDDCTTATGSFLTSPNLTVGPSPTDVLEDGQPSFRKPLLNNNNNNNNNSSNNNNNNNSSNTQGILVKRKYHQEVEGKIIPNPNFKDEEDEPEGNQKDSIYGSDSVLEIYDDDNDNNNNNGNRKNLQEKPKIPDGGWGWVVVLASLGISMVADGVSFSFGLLYIEFLEEFQESKSKTAWIGSLFMAVPLLSGPVMSALVDRYGCRKMTITGGLISGFGFILSSFSNSIEIMYLTFGVIAGLGLGLCYVTAVVSVAYWFDKKRTLAVGLGACGTGIGTFLYAPMTTYFIEEYAWRGTCLLLAGTFFNLIVCGAVMRDPEWWILEQKKQASLGSPRKSIARSEAGRSSVSPALEDFPGIEEIRKMLKNGNTPEYLLQSFSASIENSANAQGGNNFRSVVNLPTFVRQSEKVPLEVLESLSANSRLYNVILENYPSLLLCRSLSDKKLEDSSGEIGNKGGVTMSMRIKQATEKASKPSHQTTKDSRPGSTHASTKILCARRMSRKDLEEVNPLLAKEVEEAIAEAERAKSVSRHHLPGFGTGVVRTDSLPWLRRQFNTNTHYFKDIRVHRNSVMYRGAVLNLHKYRLRASSCPDIYRNSMTTLAKENEEKWYAELLELLKGMMDFSMFLEFHFLLLSLSTILLFTWFIVPYFYLAEHLTRNNYTEADGAQLLSIIGITNTIGMIGLGWAGDQPWMNVSKTYAWCLVACGIATILMSVFTHHYVLLMVTSAAFGLFFASSFSFTPVILVELIPLERFTTAYGLTLLCQGIGNLLGPPLAGWIFDVTNSWDLSFLMAGGWIVLSGLLMAIIPYTKNRKIWGTGPVEMDRERVDPIA